MDHVFEDLTQDSSDGDESSIYQAPTQPGTLTATTSSSSSSPKEQTPRTLRLFSGQSPARSGLAVGAGDGHGAANFQQHQQSEGLPPPVPCVASTLRQAHDSGSAGYRIPTRQEAGYRYHVGVNSVNSSGVIREPVQLPTSISMRRLSHGAVGVQQADCRSTPARNNSSFTERERTTGPGHKSSSFAAGWSFVDGVGGGATTERANDHSHSGLSFTQPVRAGVDGATMYAHNHNRARFPSTQPVRGACTSIRVTGGSSANHGSGSAEEWGRRHIVPGVGGGGGGVHGCNGHEHSRFDPHNYSHSQIGPASHRGSMEVNNYSQPSGVCKRHDSNNIRSSGGGGGGSGSQGGASKDLTGGTESRTGIAREKNGQGQGLKEVLGERLLALLTADNHERFRLVRMFCACLCHGRMYLSRTQVGVFTSS